MEYEVINTVDSHAVDIENRTCNCNLWGLIGIPYPHACACILYHKENVDDLINEWFIIERYKKTYEHVVTPMSSARFWEKIDKEKIVPPMSRKALGLLKRKRRSEEGEDSGSYKLHPREMTCKTCGHKNHNTRG